MFKRVMKSINTMVAFSSGFVIVNFCDMIRFVENGT